MEWVGGSSYWIAGFAFQRAVGLVYLLAFLVARNQFPALLGEEGLEPARERLRRSSFRRAPSLFTLLPRRYSDRLFAGVAWTGIALSAASALGVTDLGPVWLSMLCWLLLWALYLSIVNVGGTFYGFGWESKLLDAGFLAAFLGPAWMAKPVVVILLLRWLLFRIELGAGLIKMRGDPCWRDLTCMLYHHETQPLPNPVSWYAHRLPARFHRLETLGNHVVQLGVVWLVFAPQPLASVAGALIIGSQLWLVQSGNYSWLNFLTIAVAFACLSDGAIEALLPVSAPEVAPVPAWLQGTTLALAGGVAWLSVPVVRNLCSSRQLMNYSFNPLHLVNTYGAFGGVTRRRWEVIVEGTRDAEDGPETEWREYGFKAKPGDPRRRPTQVAPYHLRLDWQMWFLPLRPGGVPRWFLVFLRKLLEGDARTRRLLGRDPFPDAPPRRLRASFYEYRFTSAAERRATGAWWHRRLVGEYVPPVDREALRRALAR